MLQHATVEGRQVRLGYQGPDRHGSVRVVHPFGLVSKASVWYLLAGTEAGLRTFRVSRVTSTEVLDEPVVRPDGFDLAAAWNDTVARLDRERTTFEVEAAAEPEALRWLRVTFDRRVAVGEERSDGRVDVRIRSWSAHAAASDLVTFAPWVEVLAPDEVRAELAVRGAHLTRLYGAG